MLHIEQLLMVVASTLSGGVDKIVQSHRPEYSSSQGNFTCGRGASWGECEALDRQFYPLDVLIPWCFTLCWLFVLGLPTLCVRSKHKTQALAGLAWMLFEFLALVTCCLWCTDHPVITFAMTLHSCVRLLCQVQVSDKFVGGKWWWSLRYFGVLQLLVWEVVCGVPVSIVRWGRSAEVDQGVACAYLAHLGGCLVPDLVLCVMRSVRCVVGSFCAELGE